MIMALQLTPQAQSGGQGGTTVVGEDLLPPGSHEETQVVETVSGRAGQGGPEIPVEQVVRPDTQLASTSQMLSTMKNDPPLQTYNVDLTRVKTMWTELVKKSSEFDIILKVKNLYLAVYFQSIYFLSNI
jgi:hypothetical protein